MYLRSYLFKTDADRLEVDRLRKTATVGAYTHAYTYVYICIRIFIYLTTRLYLTYSLSCVDETDADRFEVDRLRQTAKEVRYMHVHIRIYM